MIAGNIPKEALEFKKALEKKMIVRKDVTT